MTSVPPPPSPWQFSLRDLFAATTTLAITLGMAYPLSAKLDWTAWQTTAATVGFGLVACETYGAWRRAATERLSVGRSHLHAALILYLPFGWLFVIDYPWSDYHLHWIKMLPVLPGFLAGALFHPLDDGIEFFIMGIFTAFLLASLTWLGRRGRWGLAGATAVGCAVSIFSAVVSYGCFRM